MDNRIKWISNRARVGWILLAAGILVAMAGISTELIFAHLSYDFRLITGVGILLAGVGIGYLVRYSAALKDERAARRLSVEERDERTVLIRTRAGSRSYWVSTALIYCGLMWVSFASSGRLPDLSGDALWAFLAAAVILPFGVYVTSILVDQRNL